MRRCRDAAFPRRSARTRSSHRPHRDSTAPRRSRARSRRAAAYSHSTRGARRPFLADLLELLRHFAGHRRSPLAAARFSSSPSVSATRFGRFVQHRRVPQFGNLVQRRTPLRPGACKESEKREPVGIEPGGDERREQRRRARNRRRRHARRRSPPRPAARRDRRAAACRRRRRARAIRRPRAARRARRHLRFVVLVIRRASASRSRTGRAGGACAACPRRAPTSTDFRTSTARKEKSPMLPMGVLTT